MKLFFTPVSMLPNDVKGVPIFGITHLLWLLTAILFCITIVNLFYKADKTGRKKWLSRLSWMMLLSEIMRLTFFIASGSFDPAYMLPLHLCGVMVFIEFIAVRVQNDFIRELCWGLGMPGAGFALLTPGETQYPLWNFFYLQFIFAHVLLFLIPVLFAVNGFKPEAHRLPECFVFLLFVAMADGAVNNVFGGNYLFLGRASPGSPLEVIQNFTEGWYIPSAMAAVWIFWGILYFPQFLRIFFKRNHRF